MDVLMNAAERKSLKRATESQKKWKVKALARGNEVHFLNEKIDDLEKSRSLWRAKAEEYQDILKKNNLSHLIR